MSMIDRMFVQIATAIESFKSEAGQGMVEYGLILSLIAVACVIAFGVMGGKINDIITAVNAAL